MTSVESPRADAVEAGDVANPHIRLERLRLLAPGVYTWLLTAAQPLVTRDASLAARLFSVLAVIALVAATFVPERRAWLVRALGIYAFIGLSVLACCLGPELSLGRLDPLRSALGMLGWVTYAFAWGRSRGSRVPEDDPHVLVGAPLVPRARLAGASLPIVAFALLAALTFGGLAFRVDRPEHALFAHAAATAAALLVLSVGARIALAIGTPRELAPAGTRLNATAPPLAVLAVLLGAGLVWSAFSR